MAVYETEYQKVASVEVLTLKIDEALSKLQPFFAESKSFRIEDKRVSFKCQFLQTLVSTPAVGSLCTHFNPFDLQLFL